MNINYHRGYTLVSVMLASWCLMTYTAGYIDNVLNERRIVVASENTLKSEAIAEGAIEEVFYEYNYGGADLTAGEGWALSGFNKSKSGVAITDVSGVTFGTYNVTVFNWNSLNPRVSVTSTLSNTAGTATTATISAQLKPRARYMGAISADGLVSLASESGTDSYDSREGAYDENEAGDNGDVSTNSTANPAISLASNSQINGDANVGDGGVISDPTKVTGDTDDSANLAISPYVVPPSLAGLPLGGTITSDQTLGSGQYRYTSIELASNKQIRITGNVTMYLESTTNALDLASNSGIYIEEGASLVIYVNGPVNVRSNNGISPAYVTSDSTAFRLLGTANCTSVVMDSNTDVVGMIDAPRAAIDIDSNVEVFGAVIGKTVNLDSNAMVHYDEKLGEIGPVDGYKREWLRRV